ncbi:MAG: Major outer membrane porin [Chlamydiales bacterium]|nr:Major outer membrane porin [Chlamydiales bacterium]MCH9620301.1 Major outer membrane porin [Chlamydiales bacterium]MCH9622788.1 Major outer membrane porin [Chlamydiales bacterium]
MRKVFLLFFLSQIALALPMSNPADPLLFSNGLIPGDARNVFCWDDAFSFRFGFYGDYVYDRNYNIKESVFSYDRSFRSSFMTSAASLTANVWKKIEMEAILGATNMSFMINGGALSSDTTLISLELSPSFSWGLVGRGILWECCNLVVGSEIQYQRSRPTVRRFIRHASSDVMHFRLGDRAVFEDWQAAIGVTYRVRSHGIDCAPYVGFTLAGGNLDFGDDAEVTFQGTNVLYTFKAMRPNNLTGFSVGITMVVMEQVSLNVESRSGDQKALCVNGQIRF